MIPTHATRASTMPHTTALLAPAFALAAWTGAVLILLAFRRVRAGLQGRVPVKAYRFGEAPDLPDEVRLPNRNYMNLLELPLLFYVVCLIATVTGAASNTAVALAWSYVGLRVAHSVIHVTYNDVMHRFFAFAISNGVLAALWTVIGLQVFGGTGLSGS